MQFPYQPRSFLSHSQIHRQTIFAVHSADSSNSKGPIVPAAAAFSTPSASTADVEIKLTPTKWALDSWKVKKALQLPEYPNQADLDSVLKTLDAFPPIVFAGEARSLEERLGEAAMGNAFLLQGGDCAESFKEFNANNIRDTFIQDSTPDGRCFDVWWPSACH
ncbi:Phospho-2-dehydro-3-deoxyheptonate aldolase 2, chloroplastic [Orobanche minor]